jgi:pentapeptide MXKDX repeat protein
MTLQGGRSLPNEAIFSNESEDCFAPAGLAMTKGATTEETMGKGAMTKETMKKRIMTKGTRKRIMPK